MLAVLHILKTGGTTIVDRYRHNPGFVYQRVANELVFNFKQDNAYTISIDELVAQEIDVVFGHGVDFEWSNRRYPVEYATVLRDPIARIVSAYNYFRSEMIEIHNHASDIDFITWFINRSRLIPTPVFAQYQHFANNRSCLYTDFGRSIDHSQERQLLRFAKEQTQNLSYVFFIEDNYIQHIDKLFEKYNMVPNTTVVKTNTSSYHLDRFNMPYIKYEDLDKKARDLIVQYTAADIEFYNYCKEKFA